MNTKKKFLAGTIAGSLAVGGFALGRSTQIERVQADPIDNGPAAVTTPSGRALPSFADLAAQASPTVVYIKAVTVEKAAQAGPQFGFPGNIVSPAARAGELFRYAAGDAAKLWTSPAATWLSSPSPRPEMCMLASSHQSSGGGRARSWMTRMARHVASLSQAFRASSCPTVKRL